MKSAVAELAAEELTAKGLKVSLSTGESEPEAGPRQREQQGLADRWVLKLLVLVVVAVAMAKLSDRRLSMAAHWAPIGSVELTFSPSTEREEPVRIAPAR